MSGASFAFGGGKPQGLAILERLRAAQMLPAVVFAPGGLPDGDRIALERWTATNGVELAAPRTIGDRIETLRSVDLLILCRFELVPEAVFTAPRLGTVNVHSSLLPRHRGIHPVSWALVEDAAETGVTVHRVDAGVDTGDVLAQRAIRIHDDHDLHSLTADLDALSATLILELMATANTGALPAARRQVGAPSRAPRRRPEDGRIDWSKRARDVFNLVRALPAPLPPAFAFAEDGARIEIRACAASTSRSDTPSGTVVERRGERTFRVRCGDADALVTTSVDLRVGSRLF